MQFRIKGVSHLQGDRKGQILFHLEEMETKVTLSKMFTKAQVESMLFSSFGENHGKTAVSLVEKAKFSFSDDVTIAGKNSTYALTEQSRLVTQGAKVETKVLRNGKEFTIKANEKANVGDLAFRATPGLNFAEGKSPLPQIIMLEESLNQLVAKEIAAEVKGSILAQFGGGFSFARPTEQPKDQETPEDSDPKVSIIDRELHGK